MAVSDLARLGSFAESARALARGLFGTASGAVDGWMTTLLGEDFNRRLARVPIALATQGTDPFGLDPQWTKWALASAAFLHRRYFRTEVHGADHVPRAACSSSRTTPGRSPIDGALIGAALFMDVEPPRFMRAMVEKWTQTLPFVSMLFSRVGQVVGVPENAQRLLEADEALLVFPEGARGISKTFDKRYQLTDFGLGFMRLAIETNTPIVPVAVVGGEEQYISVANVDTLAKRLAHAGVPDHPAAPPARRPAPLAHEVPHLLRRADALQRRSRRRGRGDGGEGLGRANR